MLTFYRMLFYGFFCVWNYFSWRFRMKLYSGSFSNFTDHPLLLLLCSVKNVVPCFRDSWLCFPLHFHLYLLFFIFVSPEMLKYDPIPTAGFSSVWGYIWRLWECLLSSFVLNIACEFLVFLTGLPPPPNVGILQGCKHRV